MTEFAKNAFAALNKVSGYDLSLKDNIEFPALTDQSFHLWKVIKSFSEIDIQPNTIVLCDIDDTLLHHPGINHSWSNLISVFFNIQHFEETGTHNQTESNKKAVKFCDDVFNTIPLQHTDREGFFDMVKKSTEFAFVTARQENAKNFTYENLKSLDIDPEIMKVHFCGNEAKGEYIVRNFDLEKYDHVVFIDDQLRNVENVVSVVNHVGLKVYRFEQDISMRSMDYYPLPEGFNPNLKFDGVDIIRIREDEEYNINKTNSNKENVDFEDNEF
jgi:hypothetical protein